MHSLSVLVHAESKVGKTWFGATTPAPRLILDAEGGTQWIPGQKVYWDPVYPPPVADGTWDTCVVIVRDYSSVQQVYQWLAIGQHQFRSVTIDSLSEIQKRAKDQLGGMSFGSQQQWGELLTHMEMLIRNFRDLTMHPINPLEAVVFIAFTRQGDGGKFRPYVQGQLSVTLPYFLDVIGYLYTQPLEDGTVARRLLVQPHPQFEAGERVGGRLGAVVDNPNVERMIAQVYADQLPDQ